MEKSRARGVSRGRWKIFTSGCLDVRGHAVVVRAARGGTRIARKISRTKWGHSSFPSKRGQTRSTLSVRARCELEIRMGGIGAAVAGLRLSLSPFARKRGMSPFDQRRAAARLSHSKLPPPPPVFAAATPLLEVPAEIWNATSRLSLAGFVSFIEVSLSALEKLPRAPATHAQVHRRGAVRLELGEVAAQDIGAAADGIGGRDADQRHLGGQRHFEPRADGLLRAIDHRDRREIERRAGGAVHARGRRAVPGPWAP